jgi:hypothetical protein
VLADRADNPNPARRRSDLRAEALVDKQIGPALFGVEGPDGVRAAEEAGGARGCACGWAEAGRGARPPGRSRRHGEEDRLRRAPALRAGDGPLGDMALSSEHVDVAIRTLRTQTFHADAFKAWALTHRLSRRAS